MLVADLKAAGIPVETEQGVVDFHSLRHTFGTLLVKAGTLPKLAMDLLRYSSADLTIKVYSHALLEERAVAIRKLPSLLTQAQNQSPLCQETAYPPVDDESEAQEKNRRIPQKRGFCYRYRHW